MTRPALLRAAALTVLCCLALLAGAGPALAHTRLVSSDPADGATVAAAPQRVSLTFNEEMDTEFATVTVTGPDGAAWQTGDVSTAGPTISIGLLPLGPAGRYEIGYRVVSDDGHPVRGSVGFVLTTPGPATAEPAAPPPAATAAPPAAPAGGGSPAWPWVVAAVVLVGAGVVAALRLGRS